MTVAGTWSPMRALDRVDAAVGGGIEHAMIHHHMRRMRRHGQLKALAPTQSEPPFTGAEGLALVVFIVLAIAAARAYRYEPMMKKAA